MKKRNLTIVFVLVATLVATMVVGFTACKNNKEKVTLSNIIVDTTNAKTEYYVNETFLADGIVVTANYSDGSSEILGVDEYELNSSAFRSDTVGTYNITIGYTSSEGTYRATSYAVTVSDYPVEITLDLTNVKLAYLVGESFTSEGITATADNGNGGWKDSLTEKDLVIDSSSFNKDAAGVYSVKVSYTYGAVTGTTSYDVEVIAAVNALYMEKTVQDYTYVSGGVTIAFDDVAVYAVDGNGISETPLEQGEYELKLYKENQEITGGGDVTESGIYQIWAYREVTVSGSLYDYAEKYTASAFIFVYVIDEPITNEPFTIVNGSGYTGVFSQTVSQTDSMSSTWEFQMEYTSGKTIRLTASDVVITGLDYANAGANKTATVSYTEVAGTSSGITEKTYTLSVTYTIIEITEGTFEAGIDMDAVEAEILKTGVESASGVVLQSSFFTGKNSFVKYTGSSTSNKYTVNGDNSYFETKGESFTFTFPYGGTLKLSVSSTGGNNESTLALRDATNSYVGADENSSSSLVDGGANTQYIYTVKGNTATEITYTLSAGTYVLVTDTSSTRATRVYNMEITYTYSADTTNASLTGIAFVAPSDGGVYMSTWKKQGSGVGPVSR